MRCLERIKKRSTQRWDANLGELIERVALVGRRPADGDERFDEQVDGAAVAAEQHVAAHLDDGRIGVQVDGQQRVAQVAAGLVGAAVWVEIQVAAGLSEDSFNFCSRLHLVLKCPRSPSLNTLKLDWTWVVTELKF